MESEQRIQALEQEVQILKTQIQSILLDIQTHLLTNTYPALRGHHTAGSSTEDEDDDDEYDRAAPAPKVRKVSGNNAIAKKEKAHAPVAPAEPMMASLDEQQEWVLENIQNLGVTRTRELIESYTAKRRFTPEVSDTLMRFTDMYAAAADTPTIPSRPEGFPTVKSVTSAPQQPVKRAAQQSIPAPQPAKAAPKPVSAKPKAAAPIEQPVIQQTAHPVEAVPASEIEDSESSLVLRLIAGVQNAGAGVRWGKTKN